MAHMNQTIVAVLLAAILGVGVGYAIGGARASSVPANHAAGMEDAMTMMTAELEGKQGAAFDQAFLAEMIAHHQGAIEMAELALQNAEHQELREMAQAIISAQDEEVRQMQSWQGAWFGAVPSSDPAAPAHHAQ